MWFFLPCVNQVPAPKDIEEVAFIRISDADGKIDEKKSVLIQKAESGTFVQTDKPIYTPGQTGKERRIHSAGTCWR